MTFKNNNEPKIDIKKKIIIPIFVLGMRKNRGRYSVCRDRLLVLSE